MRERQKMRLVTIHTPQDKNTTVPESILVIGDSSFFEKLKIRVSLRCFSSPMPYSRDHISSSRLQTAFLLLVMME
jgi:hypothetical protein